MKKNDKIWPDSEFNYRLSNDIKRTQQFKQDIKFIESFICMKNKKILDIGCSTGEFLKDYSKNNDIYGMETNKLAIRIASKYLSFDKDIFNTKNYFDIIIYRGTIQHIRDYEIYIQESYKALKKNGYIFFISTPNLDSPAFKIINDIYFLNKDYVFFWPSEKKLIELLKSYKFNFLHISFPYFKSPYANYISDHIKYIYSLVTKKKLKYAFYKNMMNIVFTK